MHRYTLLKEIKLQPLILLKSTVLVHQPHITFIFHQNIFFLRSLVDLRRRPSKHSQEKKIGKWFPRRPHRGLEQIENEGGSHGDHHNGLVFPTTTRFSSTAQYCTDFDVACIHSYAHVGVHEEMNKVLSISFSFFYHVLSIVTLL